jgi:hypothetical protein
LRVTAVAAFQEIKMADVPWHKKVHFIPGSGKSPPPKGAEAEKKELGEVMKRREKRRAGERKQREKKERRRKFIEKRVKGQEI